jgi:hypothetical protein
VTTLTLCSAPKATRFLLTPRLYSTAADDAVIRLSRTCCYAREIYRHLGGRSPILYQTERQKAALEVELAGEASFRSFTDKARHAAVGWGIHDVTRYAGTTGAFCLRSAFITCGSSFKCASTSSGGVSAIH